MASPYIKFVTEIDLVNGYKHSRYFRFPLDAGKDFCYRSRTSINAFAFSGNGMNYKPNKKHASLLYHFQDVEDKQVNIDLNIELLGKDIYADIPVIDVENIWEFYKAIGYNYKKKKYIS